VDEIVRDLRTGRRTFRVYTKEEADEAGIQYKPWEHGRAGDWVLSDDGYVAECYLCREYRKVSKKGKIRVDRFVRLAFGAYWINKNTKCEYGLRKMTGDYSTTRPQSWGEREARRKHVKHVIRLYARMWFNNTVDLAKLGRIYAPKQRIPEASFRRLLRQPEIKEMVNRELKQIFRDNGIDEKYVLELYKNVARKAGEKENLSTLLRVADTLADMLRMTSETQEPEQQRGGLLAEGVVDEGVYQLMDQEDQKMRQIKSAQEVKDREDEAVTDAEYDDAPRTTEE
jgi:hypothetical protein